MNIIYDSYRKRLLSFSIAARWPAGPSEFRMRAEGHMKTFPDTEEEWKRRAADYIKQLLYEGGTTYEIFARDFKSYGFEESRASITLKLQRGSFSAAWFLAVLAFFGVDKISIVDEFNTSRVRRKIPNYRYRSFIHK